MAAGRRKKHGEQENEERWLLTYADMITLLMALFMVLFSISSVNVSKYKTLQQSLKAAFSGSILPGGKALMQSGAQAEKQKAVTDTAIPSIVAINPTAANQNATGASSSTSSAQSMSAASATEQAKTLIAAAKIEQQQLKQLKEQLDTYLKAHGLQNQVQTTISRRGLVVRVLTDKVLFDSGQATLKSAGAPRCSAKWRISLNVDRRTIRSRSRDTPTTSRSQAPNTRATGSCRPPARRPLCAPHQPQRRPPAARRPPATPTYTRSRATRPTTAGSSTAVSRSCCCGTTLNSSELTR